MDDNSIPSVDTEIDAPAPAVKKQRAPRRKKSVVKASASISGSTVARSQRGGRRKAETALVEPAVERAPKEQRTATATKSLGAKRGRPKGLTKSTLAPTSAADEMADLLQLEEENKRLRKSLAEKLRSENADLRKRLGIN